MESDISFDGIDWSGLAEIAESLTAQDSQAAAAVPQISALGSTPPPSQPQQQTPPSKPKKPAIEIIEQPAGKAQRFRYECEGRSAGSIPGVSSTSDKKTYPSIKITNCKETVVVVVSCVTADAPYRPHPHKIVGKENCKRGICTVTLNGETRCAVFSNIGIQCVKKKDTRASLEDREQIKVDPFKTGFEHKNATNIDLNVVRLCFQAFVKKKDSVIEPLTPVVSEPIYDKKANSELTIHRLCSCSAKVGGGDEIILLCDKLPKGEIRVRFFELDSEAEEIWWAFGVFEKNHIHKQTAITFRTPRYRDTDISEKAKVFIQLYRPSDNTCSEPIEFEYYPDPDTSKRKRMKAKGNPNHYLQMYLQNNEQQQRRPEMQNNFNDVFTQGAVNFLTTPDFMAEIKNEPATSPHFLHTNYRNEVVMTPSPQPPSPLERNNMLTPSPGLRHTSSAGSPQQMFQMHTQQNIMAGNQMQTFNYATIEQQQQPQQQQQQQHLYTYNNSNNVFATNNANNNNTQMVVENNVFAATTFADNNVNNNNNKSILSLTNPLNRLPSTSGGSMTPILQADDNCHNNANAQNMLLQLQQQQHHQQQQNITAAPLYSISFNGQLQQTQHQQFLSPFDEEMQNDIDKRTNQLYI